MDRDELVRDALPVNQPYDGLVAEAYDEWLPPDGDYADRKVFHDLIARGDGPALELGCGNGRLLAGYVAAGLDVEGCDSSADMLAICRRHVEAGGHRVTLHLADWVHLDLPGRYATLYNPAGSFSLIDDLDDAHTALATWHRHLLPGGSLVLGMGVPAEDRDLPWTWRIRRSATRAGDGVTFMVHQAVRHDREAQLTHSMDRHEVWDADGTLRTTFLRRHLLRWWTRDQLAAALRDTGFAKVDTVGGEGAFLVFARTA